MFSKLRYPKALMDSTIKKFNQELDKEIHTIPSADPSVYIVLPFTVDFNSLWPNGFPSLFGISQVYNELV